MTSVKRCAADANCRIELHWTVQGNDDNAVCLITYEIKAEEANPPISSPAAAVRSNASNFGRAVSFTTQWPREHDGREVTATVLLTAQKAGRSFVLSENVTPILVRIDP